MRTLFLAQALGSAGFLAASTVSPIVGARLGGGDAWAGVPTAMYQAGVALFAMVWGRAFDALGRRPTLVLGGLAGLLGAALATAAVTLHHLLLFLFGILFMGAANAALQLGRFVAAEVSLPEQRGRALSRVVLGSTVGAVLGPWLVGPAGALAQRTGLDVLSGPYAASAVLFVLVAGVLSTFLRPEPRELAQKVAALGQDAKALAEEPRPLLEILRDPQAALAVLTMVTGQVVMVMLMVLTSVHMSHHAHGLPSIAAVLSSHVFGMFAFSVVSGRLTDRLGRRAVIGMGAGLLILACALAPLSVAVWPLGAALLILGVGWNFCYVAGSALLADRLRPAERGRTQGFNDFVIGSVSAVGSILSGLAFARFGYAAMAVAGGVVSAALLLAVAGTRPGARDQSP